MGDQARGPRPAVGGVRACGLRRRDEAITFEHDPKALGVSQERDDRGLLKREPQPAARRVHGDVLTLRGFVAFFEKCGAAWCDFLDTRRER